MTSSSIVEHRSSLDFFLLKHSFNSIFSFFFIMSRLFKERFEASFFIVEDNDSFAEIITPSMTMKALKKRDMMKKKKEIELNECFKRKEIERRAMLDNRR